MDNLTTQVQSVTDKPGENALFMVFSIKDIEGADDKLKDLIANFSALIRSMKNRYPELDVSAVMGFGALAWQRLFPNSGCPKELEVFKAIKGDKYTAPSTPGDLFFHLRAKRVAAIYEIAEIINEKLQGVVICEDEVQGFRYFDGRAILGFVDGTENPDFDADDCALIGDEDPLFKGGSYAFAQKYLHNMIKWKSLTTEEQEKTIGRKKFNDVELSDEEKPQNAHNAVTNIADDEGNDLKIIRSNMPFANPARGEFGTYFVGYANTFSTTNRMLRNMFIGEPVGNTDRLLDFSTAVTGTLFFIPTFAMLDDIEE